MSSEEITEIRARMEDRYATLVHFGLGRYHFQTSYTSAALELQQDSGEEFQLYSGCCLCINNISVDHQLQGDCIASWNRPPTQQNETPRNQTNKCRQWQWRYCQLPAVEIRIEELIGN
jgi:hypothetical protein